MARSESVTRVGITPEAAFEMWSDMIRLSEFLPGILEAKKAGDGVYSLVLRAGGRKETTRVAYSVLEHPRRIVWRSKGGAKWNGEVILRPVAEGTEVKDGRREAQAVPDRDQVQGRLRGVERLADRRERDVRDR